MVNCFQTNILAIYTSPAGLFIAAKLLAERCFIAVLLVFYDSKRSIGFLKVFFTGSTIRSDDVLT